MATKIVEGLDKSKDCHYWTIILDRSDAIRMPKEDWEKFKKGIAMIKEVIK